jgi:hypothetical protein
LEVFSGSCIFSCIINLTISISLELLTIKKIMLKQIMFFSSIATLSTSILLLQLSSGAETKVSQNIWQQPYTPTNLQWLSTNLQGRGERKSCGVSTLKGVPLAFYEWQNPIPKDQNLVLFVFTTRPPDKITDYDRNFCIGVTFAELRRESLKMAINPPIVELRHFRFHKNGQQIPVKTYKCSVPGIVRPEEPDYDFGGFNVCR